MTTHIESQFYVVNFAKIDCPVFTIAMTGNDFSIIWPTDTLFYAQLQAPLNSGGW